MVLIVVLEELGNGIRSRKQIGKRQEGGRGVDLVVGSEDQPGVEDIGIKRGIKVGYLVAVEIVEVTVGADRPVEHVEEIIGESGRRKPVFAIRQ